jgi:hypothetical protein
MATETHKCPSCGAPRRQSASQCPYCGTWFDEEHQHIDPTKPTKDDLRAADFGIPNPQILIYAIIGAAIIYAFGWRLEDTEYLLETGAVIIWVGILPLWIAAFAFVWKAYWVQWVPGFAFALPIFFTHIVIIWFFWGNINDDAVGISAMFAGAALLGWLVGRALHIYIQHLRARQKKIS